LLSELSLPVSRESVRKKSLSEAWKKRPESFAGRANAGNGAMVAGMVALTASGNLGATLEAVNTEEARAFKSRETPVLDELDRDEPKQGVFVREYCRTLNGTQSAIRAGYSPDSARTQASDLLAKPNIQAACCELRDETLRKLEVQVEELVRYWVDVLRADPNALTSYRRHCCPYCHSESMDDEGRRYRKYTPSKFHEAKAAHDTKAARALANDGVDIGEFEGIEGHWYDKRRAIDPTCPECHGEGVGNDFISDTRFLPPGVQALFQGVKKTREGIEILMASKEKAADQLGRFLGAFKDREINANVTTMNIELLQADFERMMKQANERQRRVLEERGIPLDGELLREG
jgi:phage terminase small subunit